MLAYTHRNVLVHVLFVTQRASLSLFPKYEEVKEAGKKRKKLFPPMCFRPFETRMRRWKRRMGKLIKAKTFFPPSSSLCTAFFLHHRHKTTSEMERKSEHKRSSGARRKQQTRFIVPSHPMCITRQVLD